MVSENRRRWLATIGGVALGIAVFGATGPSATLAQQDDIIVDGALDEASIHSLIEEIFAEVFGGDVAVDDAVDDAAVSGGGDINVGGNMGGSVTMGGGSGGGISVGGGYSGS